jgi:hypothetical protein
MNETKGQPGIGCPCFTLSAPGADLRGTQIEYTVSNEVGSVATWVSSTAPHDAEALRDAIVERGGVSMGESQWVRLLSLVADL